jgi:predicted lipid-binding transport protein (Tim44 family)
MDEDLDFVYSPSVVARKADKTRKLLEFIARTDAVFDPTALQQRATQTFVTLQECWQAREYGPMQSLLMADLYAQHCGQLQGLRRNHEINIIADLEVKRVDLVNIRYTHKESDREFTALITARAQDYYVDDRSNAFQRGDESPATFQEFWTFQWQDGKWLLRSIEQTRESDVLKDENFFEQFTDAGRDKVYAETAGQEGPAGPWLEKGTETKASRTERMLNFLVQTDKLWNRQAMLQRARDMFTAVMLAQENGDPNTIPADGLFPDTAEHLRQELTRRRTVGTTVEYRNLCVRKVELVLVQNFADSTKDEFTVRISAHAQKVVCSGGQPVSQQEYVTPFEEYWTFGRLDNQWKLKEVVPPAQGEQLIGQENVDQESSPDQVKWYYSKTRAN